MRILLAGILAILLGHVGAVHAVPGYQAELALIAHGQPAQAYAQLRPKLLGNAGNPDFDTAFGLAALDSGAPAEAITAFERVLAMEPSNLPVRTELARAYAKLGDPAAAKRELELVQKHPQTPSEVRTNLSHYTSVLEETLGGGPRSIHATLTTSAGYDSNINTATTAGSLVIPALSALGPARLEGNSRAQESAYAEAGATATITQPLTPGSAIFGTASVDRKTPFETSDYTQTTLGAEGGVQLRTPEGDKFTLSLSGQQFWLGGSTYSRTLASNASWQHPLGDAVNLSLYGTASHVTYESTMPAANRFLLGTMVDTRTQGALPAYLFAGVYGGMEEAEGSSADYFSHNLAGAQAGVEISMKPDLSLFADLRYEHRAYDAPYPLFFTERQDNQWDATTGMSYTLTPSLLLRPTVSYRKTTSNIGFYDYSRWLANVGLRYTL